MTQPIRRVGMFGGAFDPPHRAHVALAQAAIDQLQLDELRIFPTGQAWHKPGVLSAAQHRLAMSRLAFDALPHAVIDDRELRRPGATYTIDTLRELAAEQPQARLFLVMGQDQAQALTRWKEWEAILEMAVLCMAERPSQTAPAGHALPAQARLQLLRMPAMSENATEVRERVAAGKGVAHLVPLDVARYIDQHSLYRPS